MTTITDAGLQRASESEFSAVVNEAYKAFESIFNLSQSPLATSPLVEPTLVLDDMTPTPTDRGRGLQLVLRWAVEQLAPASPRYPIGTERPWDDPTWREPAWWHYSILRHRYVEPLHPDAFVEGGHFTETLIALTGIPSADAFLDERNRAIRAAAGILQRQMRSGAANAELSQRALKVACAPLERNETARIVLGIAAAFEGVFPRSLLLSLAEAENLPDAQPALEYLGANRLILAGDDDHSLWVSPPLREYICQREPTAQMQVRHYRAASFFRNERLTLPAVRHLHRYQQHYAAAIDAAQQALALREQSGDLLQVAKSLGKLGLLFTATSDHTRAIAAHREAHAIAQRLGNRELAATASLNTGLAYHMAGKRRAAIAAYRASLALAREMSALLVELRALANLAEALAEVDERHAALSCWQAAIKLAESEGFDDEKTQLSELAARFGFPLPNRGDDATAAHTESVLPSARQRGNAGLTDDDHLVLELARREGSITPRRLMEAGHVSKATATRRLAALVEMGRLIQQGRGRNTRYMVPVPVQTVPATPPHALSEAELQTILLRNLPWLAHNFGIRAIGWYQIESATSQAPVLVARFARLPELLPFLELRSLLARRVGTPVDLLPEQAIPQGHTITWFASEI